MHKQGFSLAQELPRTNGAMVSNKYSVRRFTTGQSMHEFLNKGDNSLKWKNCKD